MGRQFGGSAYLLSQMVCRGHPDTLVDEVIEVVPRGSCDITLDLESRKPGVASNPQGRKAGWVRTPQRMLARCTRQRLRRPVGARADQAR